MTSVLNNPITDSASALSYESPTLRLGHILLGFPDVDPMG
jgi:hypothetical protein